MTEKRDGNTVRLEVVFIGMDFYMNSGSIMSSVYTVEDEQYTRYDFGFLQRDLAAGKEIVIRQATEEEMKIFEDKLSRIKR